MGAAGAKLAAPSPSSRTRGWCGDLPALLASRLNAKVPVPWPEERARRARARRLGRWHFQRISDAHQSMSAAASAPPVFLELPTESDRWSEPGRGAEKSC